MGRPKEWPPKLHKNKRGYWRCKDPRNGKWKTFGRDFEKATVRQALFLLEVTAPQTIRVDGSVTVGFMLDTWFAKYEDSLSEKEVKNYRITIRALKATHGNVMVMDFGTKELSAHRQTLLDASWMTEEEKQKRKGGYGLKLSPKTANHRMTRIRTIWRWAEEEAGFAPKGSWEHLRSLKPLKTPPKKPRSSKYDDLIQVANHAPDAVGTMLQLQYWAGMRPTEVCLMRTCDIDQSDTVWVYRPGKHKNLWRGHERNIPLGKEAQELLKNWLRPDAPEAYLFRPTEGKQRKRDHYTDETYSRAIRRACKRAGVKIVSYGSRHAAKDWITRQFGLDTARAVLGQASIETTDSYGSATDLSLAKEVFRQRREDQ